MRSLADFLNHGTLPFTGRERELSRLTDLWRGTLQAEGLRSLLLVGEAGIGKSRLIQEAIRRIEAEGGATIHMKFYPESTVSVAPPLAGALWRSNAGRQLLRQEPEETMASVTDALRRFAHLRPTILIIEDIHLLAGAALREFSLLLEAMGDEPLALLSAARPVELPACGILERWPLEELTLEGLSREDIAEVWKELFGHKPTGVIGEALEEATLGNALAVRSALLGAIKQEALVQGSNGLWEAEQSFDYVIERSARSMTDGMTAHLSREEVEAAGYLASLGEVFSREGGEQLVERRLLESLIFDGVVHELSLPKPPLPGMPKSRYPLLAFTHSLVHHQLADTVSPPIPRLIELIAAGVPLYSVLPFKLIAEHLSPSDGGAASQLPAGTISTAISRSIVTAGAIDVTADWTLAGMVWSSANLLIETYRDAWGPEELRLMRATSMARRLQLLRRSLASDEFRETLERLLMLTDGEITGELAPFRIIALTNHYWRLNVDQRSENAASIDRLIDLVEAFPDLRYDPIYIRSLRDLGQISQDDGDIVMRRRVEREYEILMSDPETPESTRLLALGQIAPYLLTLYDSADELQRRMQLYEDILALPDADQFVFVTNQSYFLEEIGDFDGTLEVIEKMMPPLKARGMMRTYYNRAFQRIRDRAWLDLDLEEFDRQMRKACSDARHEGAGSHSYIGNEYIHIGVLAGAADWLRSLIADFGIYPQTFPAVVRSQIPFTTEPVPAREELIELLKGPVLRAEQIVTLRAALTALAADASGRQSAQEEKVVLDAFAGILEWLAGRRLNALMLSFLDGFADYLTPKQREGYRKRALQIEAEREAAEQRARGDGRLLVTMLGRIEVRGADSAAEPLQPRGARQKSFLGAMVACEMLAKPLERDEFLEAAGIENDDPKLARDAVNSAIYRLRDVIGRDAIRIVGEIPRLNLDRVRVDLIEAYHLFRDAADSVRHGALARAQIATLKGLEIVRGEVPFPALYEGLFEAMREDFENLTRSTIIDVARRLLRESDAASALQVLERAFAIMPDDEEIAGLYPEALDAIGNRVEAERVRRRAEAAV